jgi:hypothetical protein
MLPLVDAPASAGDGEHERSHGLLRFRHGTIPRLMKAITAALLVVFGMPGTATTIAVS